MASAATDVTLNIPGGLGVYAQTAATMRSLYKQFGQGKFLSNLGNFLGNAIVYNTSYDLANFAFSGFKQKAPKIQAEKEAPVDTSQMCELTPEQMDSIRGETGQQIIGQRQNGDWKFYLNETGQILTKNVFVNGINGTLWDHVFGARQHLTRRIDGLEQFTLWNNKHHSGLKDILEAGADILGISSHPARLLARDMQGAPASGQSVN